MENRKGVKISLLICLSIILILTILAVILGIAALIAIDNVDHNVDQNLKETARVFIIVIIVFGGIDVVIQIFGIVAISRDHYCGSLAFTIYQGISLIFVLFNLIAYFAITAIFSLLVKITILALCIIYVRQLRENQINNPY